MFACITRRGCEWDEGEAIDFHDVVINISHITTIEPLGANTLVTFNNSHQYLLEGDMNDLFGLEPTFTGEPTDLN